MAGTLSDNRIFCKDYFNNCPKLEKINRAEFDGRFITKIWADICAKCPDFKVVGSDEKLP